MAVTKNEVAEMKNEQEKLEDFLKSELMKEGDEILAEIEADESLKDISLPEEMDEGLWKKMKKKQAEKAAYEALAEKDKEALRLGREMMMLNECGEDGDKDEKNAVVEHDAVDDGEGTNVENDGAKVVKYSRKRKRRVYLLVAAVAVLALAAGMTSIGGAPFVAKIRKQLIGEREMVKVNSEREGEEDRNTRESEEEAFYLTVEDTFGFAPISLGYMPINTTVLDYEVNRDLQEACIVFENEGNIIEYQIWPNFRNKSVGYDIEDQFLEEETIKISNIEIDLKCYMVKESSSQEYVAQFENKDVYYVINSCVEKEEFLEIIKNLKI